MREPSEHTLAPVTGVAGVAAVDCVASLWRRRALLMEMIRRELSERYGTHAIGYLWLALQPIVTVAAYVLVFGIAFKSRINVPMPNADNFVVFLLAGLAPWLAVADMLGRASTAISASPGFVKQMVFPIEVLPARLVGPALCLQAFLTLSMIVYAVSVGHPFTLMWLLWPLAVFVQFVTALGFAYLIAAVGVFFRDVREIVGLYFTAGLMLSPILYQLSSAPELLRDIALKNPITPIILVFQDIMIYGAVTKVWAWIAAPLIGIAALQIGYAVFRNARPVMGDAL